MVDPGRGKVEARRREWENGKYGLPTSRSLYGASCDPLRWFSTNSAALKRLKWRKLESRPSIFRWGGNDMVLEVAVLHVGDIFSPEAQKDGVLLIRFWSYFATRARCWPAKSRVRYIQDWEYVCEISNCTWPKNRPSKTN